MTADRSPEVDALLRQAAALLRVYGLLRRGVIEAPTRRAARRWPEDPAAIDPDADAGFIAAVVDELGREARRRAH